MPEGLAFLDVGAFFVQCRSEPQMLVLVMRTSTSVGSSMRASGTCSTATSRGPRYTSAFMATSFEWWIVVDSEVVRVPFEAPTNHRTCHGANCFGRSTPFPSTGHARRRAVTDRAPAHRPRTSHPRLPHQTVTGVSIMSGSQTADTV